MDWLLPWLPTQAPRLDWRAVLDILIVAALIYGVLTLIRGTTAVMIVRGIAIVVLLATLLSRVLDLPVLGSLIGRALPAVLVAIPILFQQELRRALEQIGRAGGLLPHGITTSSAARMIEIIAAAAHRLSERRWGGLIVLERGTALGEYAKTGVELDATLSVDLLEQIFHPTTRLHDGAVIVRGDRVLAAACLLPLSETITIGHTFGTRHRAAVGITEQTDALSVVVSEETGQISIANNGRLVRNLDEAKLRKVLSILYRPGLGEELPRWLRPRPSAGARASLALTVGLMAAIERIARLFGGGPKAG